MVPLNYFLIFISKIFNYFIKLFHNLTNLSYYYLQRDHEDVILYIVSIIDLIFQHVALLNVDPRCFISPIPLLPADERFLCFILNMRFFLLNHLPHSLFSTCTYSHRQDIERQTQ